MVLLTRLYSISKRNGISYMCRYMKACSLFIMKNVASEKSEIHSSIYDLRVSLTHSGLPRILPVYLRKSISRREEGAIKSVLTILNLYRVLPYPGKVKLSTITDPGLGGITKDYIRFIPIFFSLLSPPAFSFSGKPYVLSAKGSQSSNMFMNIIRKGKKSGAWSSGNSTSGFLNALFALRSTPELGETVEFFFCSLPGSTNESVTRAWLSLKMIADTLVKIPGFTRNLGLGRLAYKEEPGKVRVFAMVDCMTQWILRPLHLYLFDILKSIQNRWGCDGTFDQDKAVDHLRQLMTKYPLAFSFDLSAATDRLPLKIQILLLNHVIPKLGDHGSTLLVGRDYIVPPRKGEDLPNSVRYATGQPMGALSSGAMLALTHHFLVQLAAYRVYNHAKGFKLYIVLGDDIVILDKRVARQYLKIMEQLQVGVNLSKSLVSPLGYAEFAKRFVSPSAVLSGLSLKEFTSLYGSGASVLALVQKMKIPLSSFYRLCGYGSFSSGNHPNIRCESWSVKSGLKAAGECVTQPLGNIFFVDQNPLTRRKIMRGPYAQLTYMAYGILLDYRNKLSYKIQSGKALSPALAKNPAVRHLMAMSLRVPSNFELIGARKLANRGMDELLLPGSQDNEKDISKKLSLISRDDQIILTESLERLVWNIFVDTPYGSQLVGGRRENFLKDADKGLNGISHSAIHVYNAEDIIKIISDDPSTGTSEPTALYPKGLAHMFATVPSEGIKEQIIRDMREYSLCTDLVFKTYNQYYVNNLIIKAPKPKPRMPKGFFF